MIRRSREAGAEALELVAALPLLGIVVLLAWQGIVLERQQLEAETDARLLARQAAICARDRTAEVPAQLDPQLAGSAVSVHTDMTTAEASVALQPHAVLHLPGFANALDRAPWPHALVRMRREPC